jgi:hypothetical protein
MDKTTTLRAFNSYFFEFINEIIFIFPENIDIQIGKTNFECIKKMNPTTLIKYWYNYITIPYSNEISNGDLTFFINKNYNDDLSHLKNQTDILKIIDDFKLLLSQINDSNKHNMLNYLNNLNKLSFIYSSAK